MSRIARISVAAALGFALLTGCGDNTECGLDQCTVTFDRGVDAKTSVLGVEAELVKVEGDKATIKVAGEELTLTVGQQGAQAEGFNVTLESVTDTQVKVKISR